MKNKKINYIYIILFIIIIFISASVILGKKEGFQEYDPTKNIKLIMNGIESGFFFNFNRFIHYLVVYPNIKEIEFNVRAKINNHLPFIGDDVELFSQLFENYKEGNSMIDQILDIPKTDWKGIPFSGGDGSKFYNRNRYKFQPYYIAFKKYITLKPELQKKLDKYKFDMMNDCDQVIGIFVRSNALSGEQPNKKMPRREDYKEAINRLDTITNKTKYFLRIDNEEDLDFYKKTYVPNYYLDMTRAKSNKGDAPHTNTTFLPLEELEKIYIEIALLANCHYIIHCSSNMVSSALFMDMGSISVFVENNEPINISE